ncbi:hypothetical protein J1N35_004450 [Gossypium stocksii]|uniref:Uncharacterized protein n=1 Tax=Gossypium stocksii TaxID=47602 RepID=A0A9D3WE57_9ROSI|nr:hypothetical protein J1N35_004450 [Gossypium stocksii]
MTNCLPLGSYPPLFTGTATTHDIWSKAYSLFGIASCAKISRLKHELHLVKKVSAEEHSNIVLAGPSQDFDSLITVVLFSPEPLALDQLMKILIECE